MSPINATSANCDVIINGTPVDFEKRNGNPNQGVAAGCVIAAKPVKEELVDFEKRNGNPNQGVAAGCTIA